MKKQILLSSIFALGLVACSNEDKFTVSDTPATVNAMIGAGTETRAQGASWDKGDAIGIAAWKPEVSPEYAKLSDYQEVMYNYYKNVKYVVSDIAKGSFNSTGTDIYFHVPENIDFCAYYPYTESSSASVLPGEDGVITINTDEGNKTTASQKTIDFMYAHAIASHDNPTISFTKANMYNDNAFHHMMTCLKVVFKLGEGFEGQSFDNSITIGMNGAKHNGTFNLRRFGWTEAVGEASDIVLFANGEKQYDVTNETITAEEGAKEVAFTLYLLPQQSKMTFPIEVSYPTSNGSKVVEYVGTIYRDLESGKKYTYNINLNKKALTVEEASIVDWENKTPGKNDAVMQTKE